MFNKEIVFKDTTSGMIALPILGPRLDAMWDDFVSTYSALESKLEHHDVVLMFNAYIAGCGSVIDPKSNFNNWHRNVHRG